jgi:hypothetical protein
MSLKKCREALNTMARKLNDAFSFTINRIKNQPSAQSKQGMDVLKWTFLAMRPLSADELRHAIAAANATTDTLDLDDLPFEKH